MAGHIIPGQSRRLTLCLTEIKLGIIEFILGEYRQVAVYEKLRPRQGIEPHPSNRANCNRFGSCSLSNFDQAAKISGFLATIP